MERFYLPISNGKISYLERKGDYPVIFLHGLGGSSNNWLKLANYFPGHIRMIMPDLCGHGRTDVPLVNFTIAEQIQALREFITGLGLQKFSLAGNSYGGWVSMRFCISGGKPENLILVDSAGINPTVGEEAQENAEKFVQRVMKMNPRNNVEYIRNFVRVNATGNEKVTTEELGSIKSRTLIVWGQKDRLIPVRYAEELHMNIKGSKLEIIESAGHTPHSTNPEELGPIINSFLM